MPDIAAVDALEVPRARHHFRVRFARARSRFQEDQRFDIDLAATENFTFRDQWIRADPHAVLQVAEAFVAQVAPKAFGVRVARFVPWASRRARAATGHPKVAPIALPAEGVFHSLVFVSIRKTYPMQAYKIMHGLWGMGQMMFTKYLVVVDDDVDVHNTSEVLFRLCANTDPQRDSIFTKGPSDVLDHATSEIASGSKLGIDATKKLPGEGFKRPWPPLIKMDAAVKAKVEKLFNP